MHGISAPALHHTSQHIFSLGTGAEMFRVLLTPLLRRVPNCPIDKGWHIDFDWTLALDTAASNRLAVPPHADIQISNSG